MERLQFRSIKEAATRPDFIKLLSVGLKTKMFDVYNNMPSEYEQLVSFEDSTKDKEDYPSLSNLGDPEKVLEGEEFREDDIGEMDSVSITNYKFGRIIAISREMIDDDQTKKIAQQPVKLGQAHKNYENKTVFTAIVGGHTAGTCYDTLAIFTTNHYDRTGGTARAGNDNYYTCASLSAGSYITATGMINLWTGLNNEPIIVFPTAVVVSQRLSFAANWLFGGYGIPPYAATAAQLGAANTAALLAGASPIPKIKVITCQWFDKLSAYTQGDWWIWTNVPGWVFQWRDKLELYEEGNLSKAYFERDVMRWKSRERFGFKCIDWRASMMIA